MKKRIIFIIFIVLVLAFAILMLKTNNNKVEEKDGVSFFLDLLKKETQFDFSRIENSKIDWRVVDENSDIVIINKEGKEIKAKELSRQEVDKLNDFFQDNGFELDIYNVADGPEGSLSGYRKNKMYCLLSEELGEVVVKCAI